MFFGPIAGACAIFCIHGEIIGRSQAPNELHKAHLTAATVAAGLVLLGLTLSAMLIFVPYLILVPA